MHTKIHLALYPIPNNLEERRCHTIFYSKYFTYLSDLNIRIKIEHICTVTKAWANSVL